MGPWLLDSNNYVSFIMLISEWMIIWYILMEGINVACLLCLIEIMELIIPIEVFSSIHFNIWYMFYKDYSDIFIYCHSLSILFLTKTPITTLKLYCMYWEIKFKHYLELKWRSSICRGQPFMKMKCNNPVNFRVDFNSLSIHFLHYSITFNQTDP